MGRDNSGGDELWTFPPKDTRTHLEDRSVKKVSARGEGRVILLQSLKKAV
jgi:hypothetical protein